MTQLNIGDLAPDFSAKTQDGTLLTSNELRGKKIILYFYPKDSTPGCTAEACSLRDGMGELAAAGYAVVGISGDSTASHIRFKEKQQLNFPLVADTDKTTIQSFGAWGEKRMAGRTYMGILRTTFVIDGSGVIERVITKVDTKNAAKQILENA